MKFERNDGRFQKIFTRFIEHENKGLTILDDISVDPITKKIIDLQLLQWGFKDTDNSLKTINNLGEFVSLLYAYHLEIPYIHTSDRDLDEAIQMKELHSQYKGIKIIAWNQVSGDITNSESERMVLNQKVESENKIMNRQFKQSKIEKEERIKKQAEERILDRGILALQKRFSSR